MPSNNRSKQWRKKAKKAIKKTHRGVIAIGVICLLLGFAIGYIGSEYLSENDCFILNGEKNIAVPKDSSFTYMEEGAQIISLGRDLSAQVIIDTTLPTDANGNYIVDTSTETTYVITYTVDDIKYGNIKRIRTITVVGGE